LLLKAFPPTSAIILAFEVLRQTNFRVILPLFHPLTRCIFFRCGVRRSRKTKIIAEQIEMSKLPSKNCESTPR
jgi:hypothetical protein